MSTLFLNKLSNFISNSNFTLHLFVLFTAIIRLNGENDSCRNNIVFFFFSFDAERDHATNLFRKSLFSE